MIKFCQPIIPNMDSVSAYIEPSFKSGQLSNFGQAYGLLAERLHKYMNISEDREIVIVSSGHTALQAAYYIFGIKTPLVPDYTFRSTMVAAEGMATVSDCDEKGFLDIENANGHFDGAILVCPISRIPDLQYYHELCKNMGKPLIIDGAATFGTKDICNYGDAFCISFHATKTFSIGEGGAVICSKENAKKIRQFINFGFDDQRNPVMYGTNAKVSEYTCAIGLAVLDKIEEDSLIKKRKSVSDIYKNRMKQFLLTEDTFDTIYQTFPVYLNDSQSAEIIRNKLARQEVNCLQYYRPLIGLPNAKKLYDTNICLPCHHGVTEEEANLVCDIILGG